MERAGHNTGAGCGGGCWARRAAAGGSGGPTSASLPSRCNRTRLLPPRVLSVAAATGWTPEQLAHTNLAHCPRNRSTLGVLPPQHAGPSSSRGMQRSARSYPQSTHALSGAWSSPGAPRSSSSNGPERQQQQQRGQQQQWAAAAVAARRSRRRRSRRRHGSGRGGAGRWQQGRAAVGCVGAGLLQPPHPGRARQEGAPLRARGAGPCGPPGAALEAPWCSPCCATHPPTRSPRCGRCGSWSSATRSAPLSMRSTIRTTKSTAARWGRSTAQGGNKHGQREKGAGSREADGDKAVGNASCSALRCPAAGARRVCGGAAAAPSCVQRRRLSRSPRHVPPHQLRRSPCPARERS